MQQVTKERVLPGVEEKNIIPNEIVQSHAKYKIIGARSIQNGSAILLCVGPILNGF